MDIKTLVLLVMDKIKEVDVYSELDDTALFKSIYKYLDQIYKKNFYLAQKRIESEELKGKFLSSDYYKKEYEDVEDIVVSYANKLAAISKDEI